MRLTPAPLRPEDVLAVARGGQEVEIDPAVPEAMAAARAAVEAVVASGEVVYGVTTGFGALADVVLPRERLSDVQVNLLRQGAGA
jgi:histidine ammonia-lyase